MATSIDAFVQSEELKSSLDKILKELKENNKIFNSIQKSLDLIYNDRDLLKDIVSSNGAIKELILALEKHNEVLTKDVQHEVASVSDKVTETSEAVKDTVEHHVDNLAEKIESKKVITVKKKGIFG